MTTTATHEQPRGPHIVHGPDSPLVELVRTCRRIAASEATVLLTGETGTGKEVFARYIHEHSGRAGRALVPVNCGAIPETLLESELFGHVRGAFTGAVASRRGRIAAADGGTLFLDEIGELPLSLQVKLLRVLQERTYEPVGATESVPANFRLVAATNKDLAAEVAAGRFRRDLYYRLLVCPVEVPPLRARNGDAARLFMHFWSARGERRTLDPAVSEALAGHDWPGNVRELENLVERLAVCAEGPVIRLGDLPASLRSRRAPLAGLSVVPPPEPCNDSPYREPAAAASFAAVGTSPDDAPRFRLADDAPVPVDPALAEGRSVDLPAMLRRLEEAYIDAALTRTGGNKKAAADLLGLQRTTLVEKLRRRNRELPVSMA
ncbi:MAG: sigma 54-interacting transcriptional regulator [Anaeromyxobacter sp.]|nr:sigma 54-interacting transcriptional regulator [Anaeromyxobacter sp.]